MLTLISIITIQFILIWGSILLFIECTKRMKDLNSYGVVEKDTPLKTFSNQEEIGDVHMYDGLLEEYCLLLEENEMLYASLMDAYQPSSSDLQEVKQVEVEGGVPSVSSVPSMPDIPFYSESGISFEDRIDALQREIHDYENEPTSHDLQDLSDEEAQLFDSIAFDGASLYPEAGTEIITDQYERSMEERGGL